MENAVAANVLGTMGAVCWSIQLIPQIIKNYRRHHTIGLQPTMLLLWSLAGLPLGVYNVVSGFNLALQIQPQILIFLSLITWSQCRYYCQTQPWTIPKLLPLLTIISLIIGGIEAALIIALRVARDDRGITWPLKFMAVLSAVLLCAGVARHYVDVWKTRSVRGLSLSFVSIDALGDLTSLLSLLFERHLDVLGLVIYGSELCLWLGILGCVVVFNWVLKKDDGVDEEVGGRSLENVDGDLGDEEEGSVPCRDGEAVQQSNHKG